MPDAPNDEQVSTTYQQPVDSDPLERWHILEQEWVYFEVTTESPDGD